MFDAVELWIESRVTPAFADSNSVPRTNFSFLISLLELLLNLSLSLLYIAAKFHEYGYSTGHRSRLNRSVSWAQYHSATKAARSPSWFHWTQAFSLLSRKALHLAFISLDPGRQPAHSGISL